LSNGAYTSGWAERFWLVLSPGFLSSPAACGCSAYVDLVLPLALMSDIHDWAGLALGFFVAAHLFFKRCMDPNDDQKNPYQGTIVALM
jgi:hypothetical protein